MTEQQVHRAGSAAAFLSLIPPLLGYQPEESLLIVPFDGSGKNQTPIRADLDKRQLQGAAEVLAGLAYSVPGVASAALIAYTSDALEEAETAEGALLHMEEVLARGGLSVEQLIVASDGWMVKPDGQRGTLEEIEVPDRLRDRVNGHQGRPVMPEPLEVTEDMIHLALSLTEGPSDVVQSGEAIATGGEYLLSGLIGFLHVPSLRDVIILTITGGLDTGDEGLQAQLAWEAGGEYPVQLAQVMWGAGPRPDPDRLQAALKEALLAAASAPEGFRAGPYATAAWLSWALGKSTHAQWLAGRALDDQEDHGLAQILSAYVSSSYLPEWATRPEGM